jgi:hypothetical protein
MKEPALIPIVGLLRSGGESIIEQSNPFQRQKESVISMQRYHSIVAE